MMSECEAKLVVLFLGDNLLRCRTDDRPLESGVQTQDSNRPELPWFKRPRAEEPGGVTAWRLDCVA